MICSHRSILCTKRGELMLPNIELLHLAKMCVVLQNIYKPTVLTCIITITIVNMLSR